MDEITISVSTCEETGVLVASWDDPGGSGGLTTQAIQLGDLERNIGEAVAVHFEPGELPKHYWCTGRAGKVVDFRAHPRRS